MTDEKTGAGTGQAGDHPKPDSHMAGGEHMSGGGHMAGGAHMAGGDRGLVSWPERSAEFRANFDVVTSIGERTGCRTGR